MERAGGGGGTGLGVTGHPPWARDAAHNPPPPVRESRISRTAPNSGPYSGFSEP